jgi:large subunit ribosomal protein L30
MVKIMSQVKVTLIKSVIDRPERQKRTVIALGLSRPNTFVTLSLTPQVAGMIAKVSHLVKVENI